MLISYSRRPSAYFSSSPYLPPPKRPRPTTASSRAQVKAVEGQFAHQQRELAKSKEKARLSAGMGDLAGGLGGGKKEKAVEPPRLVDLFVTQVKAAEGRSDHHGRRRPS